jgi:iron complex outermembrane recepter protein
LNSDVYYTHFQGTFTSIPDQSNTSAIDWVASGDAVTKGFEGEVNVYLIRGLSFYVNGTAGKANYVTQNLINSSHVLAPNPNYNLWVANTPSNTEAFGLTYQQKHFEIGIFDKRIGPMWNDLALASGLTANQVIPIDPFSVTNLYFNYVLRNGSRFDQTKFKLSFNNLFNNQNIVGDQQAFNTTRTHTVGPGDLLALLATRSVTMTVTFGLSPKR